jgi:hypothetical protein
MDVESVVGINYLRFFFFNVPAFGRIRKANWISHFPF